jgi:hypothetical protein
MSAPEPKRHIVRPFGLIGGDYEVDDAGRQKYVVAAVLAALGVGLLLFSEFSNVPIWFLVTALALDFIIITALCVDVVRKGRKVR